MDGRSSTKCSSRLLMSTARAHTHTHIRYVSPHAASIRRRPRHTTGVLDLITRKDFVLAQYLHSKHLPRRLFHHLHHLHRSATTCYGRMHRQWGTYLAEAAATQHIQQLKIVNRAPLSLRRPAKRTRRSHHEQLSTTKLAPYLFKCANFRATIARVIGSRVGLAFLAFPLFSLLVAHFSAFTTDPY